MFVLVVYFPGFSVAGSFKHCALLSLLVLRFLHIVVDAHAIFKTSGLFLSIVRISAKSSSGWTSLVLERLAHLVRLHICRVYELVLFAPSLLVL